MTPEILFVVVSSATMAAVSVMLLWVIARGALNRVKSAEASRDKLSRDEVAVIARSTLRVDLYAMFMDKVDKELSAKREDHGLVRGGEWL